MFGTINGGYCVVCLEPTDTGITLVGHLEDHIDFLYGLGVDHHDVWMAVPAFVRWRGVVTTSVRLCTACAVAKGLAAPSVPPRVEHV